MKHKYQGSIVKLKTLVASTGIPGKWTVDQSGKHVFRSHEGGVLNWWPNKTILFQGKPEAKTNLEKSLKHLLSGETDNFKPEGYAWNTAEIVAPKRAQERHKELGCAKSALLLKRVKDVLSCAGLTINKISNKKYIVSEATSNNFCSLVQRGTDLFVQEI